MVGFVLPKTPLSVDPYFQVLTSRIYLQVLLGRVPCLRVGLLSGMALQLVLTTLPLSDVFHMGFIDTSLTFVRCFTASAETMTLE